jgi:hypothetical protein
MEVPNPVAVDPSRECCANCAYCHPSEDGRPECWLNPPTPVGFAMAGPSIIPGGPPRLQWFINGVRPPVKPNWVCGYFEARPTIVN